MEPNNPHQSLSDHFTDLIVINNKLESEIALLRAKLEEAEACINAIKSFLKGAAE